MRRATLPPVETRVRVSARVSTELAAALEREMERRRLVGEWGGYSLPEAFTVAIGNLAEYELDRLHRAFRRARPAGDAGQQVHFQPRISGDLAEYVQVAAEVLRDRMFEGDASRRTLIVTALCEYLDAGVGNPHRLA